MFHGSRSRMIELNVLIESARILNDLKKFFGSCVIKCHCCYSIVERNYSLIELRCISLLFLYILQVKWCHV